MPTPSTPATPGTAPKPPTPPAAPKAGIAPMKDAITGEPIKMPVKRTTPQPQKKK